MRVRGIIFIALLIVSFSVPLTAAGEEAQGDPIKITADSMEAETKLNKVTFRGKVVARQKDMTITSNELVAYYKDSSQNELKEVVATGNVRITQQDKIATGEKAVFLNEERKIILTGNPKVWQGKDAVSGERIIHYMDENRTIVDGGRVKADIHPKKKEGTFANVTGKGTD